MTSSKLLLVRDNLGRLVMTSNNGIQHIDVFPVCAFPLTLPLEKISILNANGREVGWIDSLSDLPENTQKIVKEELSKTAFIPEINNIIRVSSLAMPSVWHVETNKGNTQFLLVKEEDIRNIGGASILINDSHGVPYLISNVETLNKHSREILERFCILSKE